MSKLIVNCPTCAKAVKWSEEYPDRPFCSERCRLIDLGAWSDESYRIPETQPGEHWSEEPQPDLQQAANSEKWR